MSANILKQKIAKVYDTDIGNIFLTYKARYAFYHLLKALNISQDRKLVILPSFTCLALVLPFISENFEIYYVDTYQNSIHANYSNIPEHILKRASIIVLQNTFGENIISSTSLDISALKKYGAIIISDSAHSFGLKEKNDSQVDFTISSFGLEKIISTRVGGFLFVNNDSYKERIANYWQSIDWQNERLFSTFKNKTAKYIWKINALLAKFGVKNIYKLFVKLQLLDLGISQRELQLDIDKIEANYCIPEYIIHKVIEGIENLSTNLTNRQNVQKFYQQYFEDIMQQDRIILPNNSDILLKYYLIAKSDIQQPANTWYNPNIYPYKGDNSKIFYTQESCPNTEHLKEHIINLPTNVSLDRAKVLAESVRNRSLHTPVASQLTPQADG